jgi:apolipoprotein N-acyltransferase
MSSQAISEMPVSSPQTEVRASASPTPVRSYRPLVLSLASAGLLYLCYFPVAWGWIGWVALVPLLGLVRSPVRPRTIYLSAWCGGLAFYVPVLQWMRVADPRMYYTWAVLALYIAVYFPLGLWLLRFLERGTRLPLLLTLPMTWTALEYLRSHLFTGFSWYLLAHTQHDFLPLIQVADLTGAYGVSFLVAAVNALVFETLWARPWFRRLCGQPTATPRWRPAALLVQGMAVLLVLMATLAYGAFRLGEDTSSPGPRVALAQGSVPQQIRNDASDPDREQSKKEDEAILIQCYYLPTMAMCYQPDLVIWPETSFFPSYYEVKNEQRDAVPREWRKMHEESKELVRSIVRQWKTASLLGLNAFILEPGNRQRHYNSALLVGPKSVVGGRYDKIHRVPFGEYVPMVDWLPFLQRFTPYDYSYVVAEGQSYTRFPLGSHGEGKEERPRFTFGVVICYEDTVPSVTTPYGGSDGEPPVDFLVNISNDGWFDGTSEHEQHLAICRFRAIECRRSVARSVNMGISAVIDSNGRVLQPIQLPRPDQFGLLNVMPFAGPLAGLPWWSLCSNGAEPRVWTIPADARELPVSEWWRFKKVAGVLVGTIPIDRRGSLYARWGDWLPRTCWGVLLIAGVVGMMRKAQK